MPLGCCTLPMSSISQSTKLRETSLSTQFRISSTNTNTESLVIQTKIKCSLNGSNGNLSISNKGAGKSVCVTGASGFIASWLVKLLLQRGYTVKASVRDPNDHRKTEHLRGLAGADERLHLFKADLLEEGSFDPIIDGCDGVFHTASPYYHNVIDPQVELIDPALKGTLNVLESCAKASSVKRVVLTSSIASAAYNSRPRTPTTVIDESWYTDANLMRESKAWYTVSKTLAEEAAWKFVKEQGMELVTILPAMVVGPLLQPTLNTSAQCVLNLINGSETYPNQTFGWVDVRDVVNAHIYGFEIPSANGRYLLVERVAHYSDIVKVLGKLYPHIKLPQKCADDKPFVPTYIVSKEKTQSLGIDYIPMEVSLKDAVQSLIEKKFVSLPELERLVSTV